MEWAAQPGHHILTLADPAYPRLLLDIHDPPLLLYVNGSPQLLSRPALAIVGAEYVLRWLPPGTRVGFVVA